MEHDIQQFMATYGLYEGNDIQATQLRHRFALVDAFHITEGMRVLEIGCGQGDTTMALAKAVGEAGHVTAIDIAHGDYGAPMTLQQAHDMITASTLGKRITFFLETDFLTMEADDYDVIVLSHCLWYFTSREQLSAYFAKMAQLSARICIAEWDLAFTSLAQRNHFCAVSILALYSAFIENDGNIQQLFGKSDIRAIAEQHGLTCQHTQTVDASYLQDGAWEKDYATHVLPEFTAAPTSIQALAQTYADVMNETEDTASLNSFVLQFQAL